MLSEQDILNLLIAQGGRCYWTGVPLTTEIGQHWVMSLDRLDNSRGYEKGNLVLTGWVVNNMRGTLGPDEFRAVLDTIFHARLQQPR